MNPIPYSGPTDWPRVLQEIKQRAQQWEADFRWPGIDLQALDAAGALRWAVPKGFGGDDLPALDLHLKYEELARASLATALILTQRDSAVGLIDGAEGAPKRSIMLGRANKNSHWFTVGIAQLTTSRQGGQPALRAERIDGGYRLNGTIPWCTGAQVTPFIVAGAVLPDGNQILFLLEQHLSGVSIDRAMDLVALRATLTGSLQLEDVVIADAWILRGPTEKALGRRRNSLELGQTYLATGLTAAAIDLTAEHQSATARDAGARFSDQLAALRDEVIALSHPGNEREAAEAAPRLRGQANDLAIRATHAAVALYKGNALLATHPAQRLAREAMFLLVWSCPNPVIDCTVDFLSRAC